ncbi:MAG: Nucleoid occlusion factor SlmA [Pseudomonadota bacterium]|jgi:TetR/AcrR family transcriptional regulator
MSERPTAVPAADSDAAAAPRRTRARPGERRQQILQTLASMLEQPGSERVTTAALAKRLQVSEAALYRHFASKAQMFEGLIEFIEEALLGLVRQVQARSDPPRVQAAQIITLVLRFAERNPGMTRVLIGDALLLEHERLQARINLLFDKIEAQLRQTLREAHAQHSTPAAQAQLQAAWLMALVQGRLLRQVRSGGRHAPTEALADTLAQLL